MGFGTGNFGVGGIAAAPMGFAAQPTMTTAAPVSYAAQPMRQQHLCPMLPQAMPQQLLCHMEQLPCLTDPIHMEHMEEPSLDFQLSADLQVEPCSERSNDSAFLCQFCEPEPMGSFID